MSLGSFRLLNLLLLLSLSAAACQPIDPANFGGTLPPVPAPTPTGQAPDPVLASQVQDGILQARAYTVNGRYYAALPLLDSLFALDLPDSLRAQVLVARASAQQMRGDWNAVAADLSDAVRLGATLEDGQLNNLCWALAVLGRGAEALPYCEQAVAADQRPSVRDSRGVALALVGRHAEAADDFQSFVADLHETASTSRQEEIEQREGWIQQLARGENPFTEEVLATLRGTILPVFTGTDAVMAQQVADELGKAEIYLRFDRTDIALGILNGLLERPLPDLLRGEVLAMRGDEYISLNDLESAAGDLTSALALKARLTNGIANDLCWSLTLTGSVEDALPYCEQAATVEYWLGTTAAPEDSYGVAMALLGRFEEAQAAFQKWLDSHELIREHFETEVAQREKWVAALARGENPFTAEVLDDLRGERITVTPRPAPSAEVPDIATAMEYADAAEMMLNMGALEEADEILALALEADPENPQALQVRVELRLTQGDMEGAMADADLLVTLYEAVGQPPVRPHYLRAEVLSFAGDVTSALEAIDTALAADREHPRDFNAPLVQELLVGRASLLLVDGHYEAALSDLSEVIATAEPGMYLTAAYALRGSAYFALEEFQNARNDLEAALEDTSLPADWAGDIQAMLDNMPPAPDETGEEGASPEEASIAADERFTGIASGGLHVCAMTANGGLQCQGDNRSGQVGDGTTEDRVGLEFMEGQLGPAATHGMVDVQSLRGPVAEIALGALSSCARLADGTVQCWGDNSVGQLGDGTTANRTAPVNVAELPQGVQDIGSGVSHVCAVDAAGACWCWGWGEKGQLGDGTLEDRPTPVRVEGLPPARTVIGGNTHSCAVLQTGGVMCWGSNQFGQLGDGTLISRTVPVAVTGLESGVRDVYAGTGMSWALMEDGRVKAWGYNGMGELGDGTTQDRLSPVDVVGPDSPAIGLAGAYYHACALLESGVVKCWGNNETGQVSPAGMMLSPNSMPIEVRGFSGPVDALRVGMYHTCALLQDGRLECWGTIP